jgi:nicotinate-nucleotide pyrophosphorylase (carboxylating)
MALQREPARDDRGMNSEKRPQGPRIITPLGTPAAKRERLLKFPLTPLELRAAVKAALDEDRAFADVSTAATIKSSRRARATLAGRADGVIAGVPLALEAFRLLDPRTTIRVDVEDGGLVAAGQAVFFVSGHARGILSAERVALNFMQRLSGIATLTRRYVDAVRGTNARILDTRKTTPGWRKLEKYAVRAGGGTNHRMDLATSVLIKDNHLTAVDGDVKFAIASARRIAAPDAKVEIECETVEQVDTALAAGADIIMLDNMSPTTMKECVARARGRAILEASGGVTLATVRAIAETGVDWISVGALTHSAPALDLGLDFTSV